MRKTTLVRKCDHCGASLKDDSFSSKDQITVSELQIQRFKDPRVHINVSASVELELLDFCNPYCLREYIDDQLKAIKEALDKEDLERQIAQDELIEALESKEPGELL